jgi:hypothetical protein
MAWDRHAIAQTQLRKHVASMAWGARNLISMQVDAALKVWLVEVNSSPAIAEALADEFAKDVVSVAVDSYLGEECAETAFVRVEA